MSPAPVPDEIGGLLVQGSGDWWAEGGNTTLCSPMDEEGTWVTVGQSAVLASCGICSPARKLTLGGEIAPMESDEEQDLGIFLLHKSEGS